MFNISLSGHTALVTGGARGIGAAICLAMAQAGADVAVNYYDCEADRQAIEKLLPRLEAEGVRAIALMADVSKEDQVEAMVRQANDQLGGVDILVNNAGITLTSSLSGMDTTVWDTMLGVILNGAFYTTRAVLPTMLERHWGSILMITTNCVVNGGGGSAAYPAAKSGVEGLMRQIVLEYAGQGIRANCIRPSVIDTDLFRQRYKTDEEVAKYGEKLPVGHVGRPEDIANAAVFLASDMAQYICGECLHVDGGRTLYKK